MQKMITIKKNRHYSTLIPIFKPIIIIKNKLLYFKYKYKFTESALYDLKDTDQHDINKLFGFSIGMHHTNSFRIGWRPNKNIDKIEILAYEYHNKIRVPAISIVEVNINDWNDFEIMYNSNMNSVIYTVNSKIVTSDIELNEINFGYTLGLYFGGNKKAPHNIKIWRK